jgi:DNA-binding XRE family transcriptional regulator
MMREVHRRRIAVARFQRERARALAADPSPLKRARLMADDGAGMTAAALAGMSGVSRQTITKAERCPGSVSRGTLRRLAATLRVDPRAVGP